MDIICEKMITAKIEDKKKEFVDALIPAQDIQFGVKSGQSWRHGLKDDCTFQTSLNKGNEYLSKGPGKSMRSRKATVLEDILATFRFFFVLTVSESPTRIEMRTHE